MSYPILKLPNYFILIACFFLCSTPKLLSNEVDTTLAIFYFEKAEGFYAFSNVDSATVYLEKAEVIFEQAQKVNWLMRVKTTFVQNAWDAHLYPSAMELAMKNIEEWKINPEMDSTQLAINWSFRGICHFFTSSDKEAGLDMIRKGQIIMEAKLGVHAPETWIFHYHRALVHYVIEQHDKAIVSTNKSLKRLENHPKYPHAKRRRVLPIHGSALRKTGDYEQSIQSYLYSLQQFQLANTQYATEQSIIMDKIVLYLNLGNTYSDNLENEKAIRYFYQGLALIPELSGEKSLRNRLQIRLTYYGSVGGAYLKKGDYKQALTYFKKIIAINPEGKHRKHLPLAYRYIGSIYHLKKEYNLALENFQKALNQYIEIHGLDGLEVAKTKQNIGDVLCLSGNCMASLDYLKSALDIQQQKLKPNSIEALETMSILSRSYRKLGNYEAAIETCEEALKYCMIDSQDSIDWSQNFMASRFRSLLATKRILLERSLVYNESYQQTKRMSDLVRAYQAAQWSVESIDTLRQYELVDIEDQFNFNSTTHLHFENALATTVKMYEVTQEDQYLKKILSLMEKSKSNALLNAIERNRKIEYADIPESLRQRAKQLQTNINQSKEKWTQAQIASDSTQINTYAKAIFTQSAQYDSIILDIENSYPNYHQLKYGIKILDHVSIAQFLEPKQAVIEYFIGKEKIIILTIDSKQLHFVQADLPKDFNQQVDQLLSAIYSCHVLKYSGQQVSDSLWNKTAVDYSTLAHELHQLLIEPIKSQLLGKESLVIIPDGVLGNLPFEALLETPAKQVGNYNEYDYLLNKYAISYAYSATLLNQAQQKQLAPKIKRELLAFAPYFPTCSDEPIAYQDAQNLRSNYFGPIKNEVEVQSICSLVPGKSLINRQATLENFQQLAPNYAFIHIASHAKANDQYPDFSLVGFTDTTSLTCNFDSLTAAQIYNIPLDAELVTLSACEGGAGKLQEGAGIRSLAMAFTYAGAKSICATLWSVQDQAMTDLMTRFYQGLSEGKNKNQALTIAKRQYINQHDNRMAHPFYWAAPIIIGDISPTQFNSFSFWPFGIGLTFILLIFGVFYLKRK